MLKILFIGDISGRIGRQAIKKLVPKIKKEEGVDFIIANAENAAHGQGVTTNILDELNETAIDFFTGGDHSFSAKKQLDDIYSGKYPIIRPANFPPDVPGKGYDVVEVAGHKILIINLIGRVFMKMDYDCPFRKLDEILANFASQKLSAIIVDVHGEATAEKIILGKYANERVTAVLGTHTHVMTADHQISEDGTAYITDVGMTGFADGSLGLEKDDIIKTFLTQIKYPHVIPEKGRAILNSVLITVNTKTGKAKSIKPITKYININ